MNCDIEEKGAENECDKVTPYSDQHFTNFLVGETNSELLGATTVEDPSREELLDRTDHKEVQEGNPESAGVWDQSLGNREMVLFDQEKLSKAVNCLSDDEKVLKFDNQVLGTVGEEARCEEVLFIDGDASSALDGCQEAGVGAMPEELQEVVTGAEVVADPYQLKQIRDKAHKLCKEYLHGSWREIKTQDLVIRKISGGLSNLLYYCALPSSVPAVQGEPTRVLLRLYGQIHGERALEGLITESVIFTLLSESQRGPRLFGVFPGGRLEEYIPARPLLTMELSDPLLSCLVAEKMALIHLMEVPINKEPHWLWDTMDRWLLNIQEFMSQKHTDQRSRARVKQLMNYSLRLELDWLTDFLKAVGSPVVFCHNDLQEGNILLRNQRQCGGGKPELVVIDFEYCSYNYRGFDFANHMCEWVYDYSNEEHPYFWAKPFNYPNREQQERLIVGYLKTMQREQLAQGNRQTRMEEVERLLYETRAFTLASHFFWALWSVVNASISTIPFDYWEYGEARFDAYFKHKAALLGHSDSAQHNTIAARFAKAL